MYLLLSGQRRVGYDIALDKIITVGNLFLIPNGEEEDVLRISYLRTVDDESRVTWLGICSLSITDGGHGLTDCGV